MSLYAISIVKDEHDIIEFCLRHASQFCDGIFVIDNGSTDGTWDNLRQLERDQAEIHVLARETLGPFRDGLKGVVFNRVKADLVEGDWVLILDADEFLDEDPRPTLLECEENGWDRVECYIAQFYVTEDDLDEEWFLDDSPVQDFSELPDHYRIDWNAVRLFRYTDSLRWPVRQGDGSISTRSYPCGLSSVAPVRPVIRHYQYRSRPQMKRRLELRAQLHESVGAFAHNADPDWRMYVQDAESLTQGDPDGSIRVTWRDRLRVWSRRTKKELPGRLKRALERRVDRWLPASWTDVDG